MKNTIYYQVIALPSKAKLSPQLTTLVETIEELMNFDIDNPTDKISRDELYDNWLQKLGLESNDKVFASYIHQLIQFSFIDRMDVKPKKVLTVDETKKMMMKQLSLMSKEDRELIIQGL